jgi:D-3-phosphoglycerate dehydrogenase
MKILVTPASFKAGAAGQTMERLKSFADTLVFNPLGKPFSEDELISMLRGCEGCIAGLDPFSKRVIENTSGLKVISRYGTGVDNVDIAAARAKGIPVCKTPGVNSQAVAELAIALLLCLARQVTMLDRKTREGEWIRSSGIELHKKTLGILGLGAVGKRTARIAAGFSMRVLAYDPNIDAGYAKDNGVETVDFDTLLGESDFISLHLPLNAETRRIISADAMRKMKRGAIIINTARGGLIDEEAACEFIKSGHLDGLGLDVYETEPPQNSPLFGLEKVVFTPHTAAHTFEAISAMAALSVQNLIDVLSGRECGNAVE